MARTDVKRLLVTFVLGVMTSAACAVDVIDLLIAYDRSAVEWLEAEDGRSPQAFAEAAVSRLNGVLPATELDKSFVFNLAGVVLSSRQSCCIHPPPRRAMFSTSHFCRVVNLLSSIEQSPNPPIEQST